MTIGNTVRAEITARDKNFSRTLGRAERDAVRFRKKVNDAFKAAGKGVAIGAGIATAASAAMTKAVLSDFDRIAKEARTVGVTTEAMSRLRHAFDQFGLGGDAVNKTITTLQQRISQAKQGLTTYTRLFEMIGVSYEALERLSPEQQFLAVVEALRNVRSQAVRTDAAMQLLGRSGRQMGTLIQGGAEGVRAEMSEIIPVSSDAAKIMEALNDEVGLLAGNFKAAFGNAIAANVEDINGRLREQRDLIAGIGDWWGGSTGSSGSFLADIGAFVTRLASLDPVLGAAIDGLRQRGADIREEAERLRAENERLASAAPPPGEAAPRQATEGEKVYRRFLESITDERGLEALREWADGFDSIAAIDAEIADIREGIRLGGPEGLTQDVVDHANREIAALRSRSEALGKRLAAEAAAGIEAGLVAYDPGRDYGAPVQTTKEALSSAFDQATLSSRAAVTTGQGILGETQTFGDEFRAAIDWKAIAFDAGADLRSSLQNALVTGNWDNLGQAFLASVQSALVGSLFSSLGGLFGGGEGILGSFLGGLGGGKQHGGNVHPGSTYLVGEGGMELFRPNVPGRIIPNYQLPDGAAGSAGTGAVMHNTQNFFGDMTKQMKRAYAKDGRWFAMQTYGHLRQDRLRL